ncbi:MAG: Ig-like domain-containing protein, partial [Gemmatimonadota bacterium]|nr:Ig-like domain-containing protein [Gemmatimonadota bacterium]
MNPTAVTSYSMLVSLASPKMTVDDSSRAQIVVSDARGTVINEPAVTWKSESPSVAQVGSNGMIRALAVGVAVIQATAFGTTGVVSVTVSAAPELQPPTSGSSIPLIITRFDGGQGMVLVSNGIPFGPGKLFPGQLKSLQVWTGGVEQRIR